MIGSRETGQRVRHRYAARPSELNVGDAGTEWASPAFFWREDTRDAPWQRRQDVLHRIEEVTSPRRESRLGPTTSGINERGG